MKQLFYLTLLLLIYNNECFITNYQNKEYVYKFLNTIIASNKASDKVLSQWTYSGNLIVQEYDDLKIFKLDNIKTSYFNGIRNNNAQINETQLSDDKNMLTEPFGVYYNSLTDVNITVTPNDELWSINMKKSIASSFLIDTSLNTRKSDIEQLIFGKCDINLEIQNSRSTKLIEKTINHKSCVEGPIQQSSNVNFVKNNQTPLQHETKRIYVISKNNCLFSIESSSNFTLQSSPDLRSTNRIEQNQYFELISTKQNTKPFKVNNNTIVKNLIYEFESTEKNETPQNKYLEGFIKAYNNFKTLIHQKPLTFLDISTKTPLAEMLNNLKKFDDNCLKKLLVGILMGKDEQYYEIFLEILPYAGTKPTLNLIKDIVKEDDVDLHLKIKLLVTFPEYINDIDEDTIKSFEDFLSFNFNNAHIKQTAILSFTTLISRGLEKNAITNQFVDKYVRKFYESVTSSQSYQNKMIYLLGLMNISNKLPLNAILNIIYNQKEYRHIRELAMYSFKNNLRQYGKGLFNKFWEIVKNQNEYFETRVAALDLILSCEISEEQFNELVEFYNKDFADPFDEHLSNYLITTIISLQNNTGFDHYLSDWATKAFVTKKLRQNLRVWSTGNYRFSFTDKHSNYGALVQAKLVSDPKTNAINVIQFNFKYFALSMNLGDYHVYLKLEGFEDLMFVKAFLQKKTETSIKDLIDLVQQCKYQIMRRDDLFIDLVVFSNKRALFAEHLDQNNIESSQNKFLEIIMRRFKTHKSISYPIMNEIKIPSDLGTEVNIKYNMERFAFRETSQFFELFQSDVKTISVTLNNKLLTQMTETINSINPLLEEKIYVEKLHHDFKILHPTFFINKSDYSVSWQKEKDSFNWILDNTIYTYVSNKTILKEHCSDCNEIEQIPTGAAKAECIEAEKHLNRCQMDYSIWNEKSPNYQPFGFSINITQSKDSEEMEHLDMMRKYGVNKITEVFNSHQGNALTFPFMKPVLYYLHFRFYRSFLDNDLIKFSLRNSLLFDEPYTTKLKLTMNQKFYHNFDRISQTFNETFNLELASTRNKDGRILSGIGITIHLGSITKSFNNQKPLNTGINFAIMANILENNDLKSKFCLNHTTIYPNRLSDRLSLDIIEPTEGITTFSFDRVVEFENECTPYFIKFRDVLLVSDEQEKIIKNMNEYKTCKQESIGYRYIPPTKSCIIAHNAASTYTDYVVDFQTSHGGSRPGVSAKNVVYQYHHTDDKTIDVSISQNAANTIELHPNPEFLIYEEPSTFADFLSTNPTEFATKYDRTCDISSQGVKTFFNKWIELKDISQNNKIAFVSSNTSDVGLTFNVHDINVVFKFWLGESIISTKFENNRMKIYLNENEIKENMDNGKIKIMFINYDVVYIKTDLVELYYSPVSLSVEIPTLFYKYLCGECLQ